jgi:hypothetical protein
MKNIAVTATDQEIRHELAVRGQRNSPARVMHVDEMRDRAYRLIGNVNTLTSELRDLLDQLDGTAARVDTRGLLSRLRTAERELDVAVVCLAGEMGLVAG